MFLIPRFYLTRLMCFALICAAGHISVAQDKSGISLTSSVDRNRIVLGEPFILSLELRFPEKTSLTKFRNYQTAYLILIYWKNSRKTLQLVPA